MHLLEKETKESKVVEIFKIIEGVNWKSSPEHIRKPPLTVISGEDDQGAGRGVHSCSLFRVRLAGLGEDSSPVT